jgi:dolichyl-phosphate-mannose--protein O-mannosyl transferase
MICQELFFFVEKKLLKVLTIVVGRCDVIYATKFVSVKKSMSEIRKLFMPRLQDLILLIFEIWFLFFWVSFTRSENVK